MEKDFLKLYDKMEIRNSGLVTIGGRPATAKSAHIRYIVDVCSNNKISSLVFSLEHSKKFFEDNIIKSSNNVFIDTTPNVSINYIIEKSKEIAHKEKIGLIAIDYIQLISCNEERKSEIPFLLNNLAKELEVKIVITSQLSRKVEERKDKIPMLEDLDKSLVENSNVVILLKPDYTFDIYNIK